MKKQTIRQRKILQVANFLCRTAGLKTIPISHLSEKLTGDRFFTWSDLDTLQESIPSDSPQLMAFWLSALSVVDIQVITATSGAPGLSECSAPKVAFTCECGEGKEAA